MVGFSLARHLSNGPTVARQHAIHVAGVAVVAGGSILALRHDPLDALEWMTWSQLLVAIVVGGCLTGWRLAQFPKARACEFHLVLPVDDWTIVAAEISSGLIRTAFASLALAPMAVLCCGLGWFSVADAVAVTVVPIVAGWLSGVLLAMVAYEPPWVRRLLERAVLAAILIYLVLFGLLGNYVVPPLVDAWSTWTNMPGATLADAGAFLAYYNPFRLLASLGQAKSTEHGLARVGAVCLLMAGFTAVALLRLTCRLRPHYLEENFGQSIASAARGKLVGDRPLSWWTARRVRRFRGRVNLYLAWVTVGLFCGWLVFHDDWPPWLAYRQLVLLERSGGGPLLAVLAIQLSVVPICFLGGLWDSNQQLRAHRSELLLTTPLTAGDFLHASAVAGWIRGRGYLAAALVMWLTLASTGGITPKQLALLCLAAGNFLLLHLAKAFHGFTALQGDRAVAWHGLLWAVGWPVVTLALIQSKWPSLALASPLGAFYILALPHEQAAALAGLSKTFLWLAIAAQQIIYLAGSLLLLKSSLAHFDDQIRNWFSQQIEVEVGRRYGGPTVGRRVTQLAPGNRLRGPACVP